MPKLRLKFNAVAIRDISLDKETPQLSVGRDPDNNIVIDDLAVSGHHCRFNLEGSDYIVEDVGSTNGTYVNAKRITRATLRHNDLIDIAAGHALVFLNSQMDVALTPMPQEKFVHGMKAQGGFLRVLKGLVDQDQYELQSTSTYIGKSDRVHVPIQGAGLFGTAPEVAASIYRKPAGYMLVAVADGYPRVNGVKVTGSVALKHGDLIVCGATTLQFCLKD